MAKKKDKKIVVILDSHAIIHRAYHALPDFSSSKGEATGALYGLSTMVFGIIKEFKPDYIFAAFDLPKPTYRHAVYADYKSGRKAIDDNLITQIKKSREVFQAFNIPILEKEGYEADDVIGTLSQKLSKEKDIEVIIASGDMDTLQLVIDDKVKVFTLKKGIKDTILYDEKTVIERFGFKPNQIPDYKGLRGDTSDNIIGVKGIGEKTATDLIQKYKTIENLYKILNKKEETLIEDGFKSRIVGLLKEHEEEAKFSKMLATIQTDVPIEFDLDGLWKDGVDVARVQKLFADLEFRSLQNKVREIFGGDEEEVIHEEIDQNVLEEASVALWVLRSSLTNPTYQDILSFTKKNNLKDAYEYILERLKQEGSEKVFFEIEKPLIPITKEMSANGIMLDIDLLEEISKEYHTKVEEISKKIFEYAGEEFNISSPKQMADILFNKMNLSYKGMRKGKSGSFSTKEEVLQKLFDEHPIIEEILKYRELTKLLGTYIDTFPTMIGLDGRLRTTFLQAGSATGRMASQEPGLQNIPVKSELGRRIRDAFVAKSGCKFVSVDYSQIELRLAAMMSGDEKLIEIFKNGEDVHAGVASYMFGIPQNQITKEQRNKAKVINFGILYGMGVSALQKNLKVDRKEAQEFYNTYFEKFSGLAQYLEDTKEFAKRTGYTKTMYGRKRFFDGIQSKLPFIRAQAERMAINAPIQGTEADIVKLAMIKVDEFLTKEKMKDKIKLVLQIHDEIIFEVEDECVEFAQTHIPKIMEKIMDDMDTKGVPVLTDCEVGVSWGKLK
ncbi:MAG: polymerase polymerase protein [Candidatus Parcubacteria bacterium]|jgi:DNA polymerase-1